MAINFGPQARYERAATPQFAAAAAAEGRQAQQAKAQANALRSQTMLGAGSLYNAGMGDKSPIADAIFGDAATGSTGALAAGGAEALAAGASGAAGPAGMAAAASGAAAPATIAAGGGMAGLGAAMPYLGAALLADRTGLIDIEGIF
jgi:hypothetical protein